MDSCSQLVHVDAQIDDLEQERKQYLKKLETVDRKLHDAKTKKVALKARTKRLDTARLRKAAYNTKVDKTPIKVSGVQIQKEDVKKELTFETDDDEQQMIAVCETLESKMGSEAEVGEGKEQDSKVSQDLFPEAEGADAKTDEELLDSL